MLRRRVGDATEEIRRRIRDQERPARLAIRAVVEKTCSYRVNRGLAGPYAKEILEHYAKYLLSLYSREKETARELSKRESPYLTYPQPDSDLKQEIEYLAEEVKELR